MTSITLIEQGLILPRVPMTWREKCAVSMSAAATALAQGGMATFAGRTVTDHQYLTRTGSSSCSPPV